MLCKLISDICYRMKQEMFVKHVCPPKLKCHCDLDL